MEVIKAKYKNGRIYLSKKPRFKKEVDVTVLFPKASPSRIPGLTARQMRKLVGLAKAGGDALRDTEQLYS